jgi:hypothetical protein
MNKDPIMQPFNPVVINIKKSLIRSSLITGINLFKNQLFNTI